MQEKRNILVLGAGNFGTCLAHHLAGKGHDVMVWAREPRVAEGINQNHRNPVYLNRVPLNPSLRACSDLHVQDYDAIVLAIPTQFLRCVLERIDAHDVQGKQIICAVKGIEGQTQLFPRGIIGSVWGAEAKKRAVVLSGPSFAVEIAIGQPTAVTAASEHRSAAQWVQDLFHADHFRVYLGDDPQGLEVAGALKNVIAIAAGACKGLGFQSNSLAAVITRGLAEITRLGLRLGAQPMTFHGLGGVGDLFLTCTSEKSRNFTVGYRLALGEELPYILESSPSIAEGVTTAPAAIALARELGVRMPISQAVFQVLYEGLGVKEALRELVAGPPRDEIEEA